MASLDDRVAKCLASLCFIDCQSSAAAHRNYGRRENEQYDEKPFPVRKASYRQCLS
jgi:hypothetical protein